MKFFIPNRISTAPNNGLVSKALSFNCAGRNTNSLKPYEASDKLSKLPHVKFLSTVGSLLSPPLASPGFAPSGPTSAISRLPFAANAVVAPDTSGARESTSQAKVDVVAMANARTTRSAVARTFSFSLGNFFLYSAIRFFVSFILLPPIFERASHDYSDSTVSILN